MRIVSCLLIALALLVHGRAANANEPGCGGDRACTVELGDYLVLTPDGYDGTQPAPAVIYFHGWQSSAQAAIGASDLVQPFLEAGFLFVAPNGANKTWAHQGSPSQARDEIAFMDQVRADLLARFNVDAQRLLVTGFSQGGSMAWDLACQRGSAYTAFAPVAGAFWRPHPESCPGGPVALLHIHGFTDGMVPLEGRGIRDGRWHQGDVFEGMQLLRTTNGCQANADHYDVDGPLRCREWRESCQSGEPLALCLHSGSHVRPKGWHERAMAWLEQNARGGVARHECAGDAALTC
ncbi:MAG: alpha/beta hydrolase family esterase [Geminicoccaceae bacterium]